MTDEMQAIDKSNKWDIWKDVAPLAPRARPRKLQY